MHVYARGKELTGFGQRSSQTKFGDQVGALGEECLQMAFGPKLDADRLLGSVVPLGPVDGISREPRGTWRRSAS
ncbi:MAG: hypothetical protein ACREHD_13650 [Pirellulales bacterium]